MLAQWGIRASVRRNETDAADARALLEAARATDIDPVRVKSVEQQALRGLHRIRSLWMSTCTARINALRGFCREFGLGIPQGARTGIEAISRVLADPRSPVPALVRETMRLLIEEIRLLGQRIAQLEREFTALSRHSTACTQLMSVPGIGLLTATAMVAATGGDVTHFKDARHFASGFGLTPKGEGRQHARIQHDQFRRQSRCLARCCPRRWQAARSWFGRCWRPPVSGWRHQYR